MKTIYLFCTSIALSACPSVLLADTLFSFGGDYSSGDATNSRTAVGTGTGPYYETVTFDDSTPMSPSTNYTGPTYYGGFEFSSSTVNGGIGRQGIRENGSEDWIYFQSYNASGWDGSELSLHTAILFKQEDWESGFTSGSNTITGLSMTTNGGYSAGYGRFLIEIGGSYYVSSSTILMNSTRTLELDETDLLSETWASYDPLSDLNFDQDTATFTLLNLNDVTAAGFYVERDSWTASGTGTTPYGLGLESFSVTGIPEPSNSIALLGIFSLLCTTVLRRPRS
ncbi:MAG: hypothetical protein ACQKBT_04600 [Puniceicoccales bacterium]